MVGLLILFRDSQGILASSERCTCVSSSHLDQPFLQNTGYTEYLSNLYGAMFIKGVSKLKIQDRDNLLYTTFLRPDLEHGSDQRDGLPV